VGAARPIQGEKMNESNLILAIGFGAIGLLLVKILDYLYGITKRLNILVNAADKSLGGSGNLY
jgi:hypothetical protein